MLLTKRHIIFLLLIFTSYVFLYNDPVLAGNIHAQNGTYGLLYNKWVSPILPQSPVPFSSVVKYLFFILIPVLLLLVSSWILFLRREVSRKTERLQTENLERKKAEESLKIGHDVLEQKVAMRTAELQKEINERKQVSEQLHNIEWLLEKTIEPYPEKGQYCPSYGDLLALNTERVILDSVGQETLLNIAADFLDLLDTSSAVYEKNGDYALGIFSSGWCRFLDSASRNLCTGDNREALNSGLWLCHESCWTESSKVAIETGQPTDTECHGGLRLYALPIRTGQEIVGAINVGYGVPPKDSRKLQEIAEKYNVSVEELRKKIEEYQERPKYIQEIAKKRLHSAARLIGEIVKRRQTEEKLRKSQLDLERRVEERTTELRKSKEEWEKTFDAMSEIVTIQDKDMTIIRANKAAHDAFQVKPGELEGKHCYEIFRGADHPCSDCPGLFTLKETIAHSSNITHENLGKIFNVTTSPILEKNGTYTHIVHVAKDITGHKRMESELFQIHKMEAIGTLAGGIAHDFNNLLAAILGYADMARDESLSGSPAKKYIDQVLKAGNCAKELVKQILTFSRKGAETDGLLQPSSIIKEGLKLMRASLPTTIKIQENIDSSCCAIIANPTNMHQVLMNLCTNALHAMEDQKGVLTVKLFNIELKKTDLMGEEGVTEGMFVELLVSDTGCGMDQKTMDRIFEPYFTTKEIGKGSGMGLALVHGIVQRLGGFVKVESELYKGTTFHVYFPAISEEIKMVEEDDEQESLPRGDGRILVVDDEEVIASMYQIILEELGYKVTVFCDSEKALEEFQAAPNSFDLIITDQTMPNISGVDLAKIILQIKSDTPIVLCTGDSAMISEAEANVIGIRRFIVKPVRKEELAFLVWEVLHNGEMKDI